MDRVLAVGSSILAYKYTLALTSGGACVLAMPISNKLKKCLQANRDSKSFCKYQIARITSCAMIPIDILANIGKTLVGALSGLILCVTYNRLAVCPKHGNPIICLKGRKKLTESAFEKMKGTSYLLSYLYLDVIHALKPSLRVSFQGPEHCGLLSNGLINRIQQIALLDKNESWVTRNGTRRAKYAAYGIAVIVIGAANGVMGAATGALSILGVISSIFHSKSFSTLNTFAHSKLRDTLQLNTLLFCAVKVIYPSVDLNIQYTIDEGVTIHTSQPECRRKAVLSVVQPTQGVQ